MTCEKVPVTGGFAIICSRTKRRKPCAVCGKRSATKLCDGLRCNVPLCEHCAVSGGKNIDFCPRHATAVQLSLPLGRPA